MTSIRDIIQVGVGMPERETFEKFARDLLGFSTIWGRSRMSGYVNYPL